MSMTDQEAYDFLGELDCGNFIDKFAAQLAATAMAVAHTDGKKKGEVTIKISMARIGNSDQLLMTSDLVHNTPTKRGKKTEIDSTETPMFIGKGGKLSINQPKEDYNGQYSLESQTDGIRAVK